MKVFVCLAVASSTMLFAASNEPLRRIEEASKVFTEINSAPDKGVPQDLLEKAKCIAIIPGVKKAGFVVGGEYGKGVMSCRTPNGWSGVSTIRVEGGSIGAQIGAGETDLILVVMNDRGADRLMESKFTIGGEGAVMAGPVGREAAAKTDAFMTAEILSYGRSRGAFAGVTLNGATIRPDNDDNRAIYGSDVNHKDILTGKVAPPAAGQPLYSVLHRYDSGTERTRTMDSSTKQKK